MEAGRELDALVAEKVMGWEDRRMVGLASPGWLKPGSSQLHNLPRYSANIRDAWEVVEKLKADGWNIHMDSVGFNNEDEGEWRTHFSHDVEDDARYAHVYDDGGTAPHAISLAALKAVGCSLEEEES